MEEFSKLTLKEHINIAANSLSSMVPIISPIITMYNEYKGEIEHNRLVTLYSGLAERITAQNIELEDFKQEYKETVSLIFEKVSRNVMEEIHADKRNAYLNYLVYVIFEVAEDQLEVSRVELFLTTLESITFLELNIMKIIYSRNEIHSQSIMFNGVEPYVISGSVNNLKNKGLLISSGHLSVVSSQLSGLTTEGEVSLSQFGKEFLKYCVENRNHF